MTILDDAQKRALIDDGYVLLPGAVPGPLVDRALRAINRSLGEEGLAKDRLPVLRASTFTPEIVATPPICDLYSGGSLPALVASAVGAVPPPSRGQVALRFPSPEEAGPAVPHIDGIAYPGNGVPPGTLQHFTALAGVFLSDVPGPDRGNFTVWPGSHRAVEERLRTRGPGSFFQGLPADLSLGTPRPIVARAGDALLAHYQLAHGIAPNLGPHVRYAVFFRLFHPDHEAFGEAPLRDLWLEWPGLHGLLRR